jgi:hypothetical protein
VLEEVVAWVTEQSGLNIPIDQLEFDIYENPRGRLNCEGKIAYRGPVSPTSGGWPKINLDLTAESATPSDFRPSVASEAFRVTHSGVHPDLGVHPFSSESQIRASIETRPPAQIR